jgi:Spy/CpxP family protein refolding chaperone
MLNRTVIGLLAGLVVATTAMADGAQTPMMAPAMGPGMMAPNMGPGMGAGPGMMGRPMGPAMAAPHRPMAPTMDASQGTGPFAGVQFNESQRKLISEMMEKERKANQQRVEAMQAAQQRLQQIYTSEKWDVDAINKVYEEIFAEQKKTITAMAKARNEVYELMTKEQKEQMKQLQEMQQARMQQMQEMRQQRIEQMRNRQQLQPQPAAQ